RVSVFAIMGGLYPAREEGHVPLAGLGEVDADHAVRPRRVPGEAGDVLSAQGGVGIVHLDEVADLLAGADVTHAFVPGSGLGRRAHGRHDSNFPGLERNHASAIELTSTS